MVAPGWRLPDWRRSRPPAPRAAAPPLLGPGRRRKRSLRDSMACGNWTNQALRVRSSFKSRKTRQKSSILRPWKEARQVSERIAQESIQRTIAALKPIMEVWLQEPNTLILRVDEERMIYVPTPGRSMEIPMSGEWIIWQDPEGQSVRARVYWDGDRLALERRVGSRGQVRSVLEIVDGRLRISRALRVPRMSTPAPRFVLTYDRDEGGE